MLRHRPLSNEKISNELSVVYVSKNGERLPLTAFLRFDPDDPIAVTLVIRVSPDRTVRWRFARELLDTGTHHPSGLGDVRIQPEHRGGRRVVAVSLTSPDGHADLELPADRVRTFLRQSYSAVPSSAENDFVDWDDELARLLRPDTEWNDSSSEL